MTEGPTNPPKLPTELITAMPVAAENPARNRLGMEKNGPKKLEIPIATSDQSVITRGGERVALNIISAMPATMRGMAAWYLRSSLWSELRDTRIIATKPAR